MSRAGARAARAMPVRRAPVAALACLLWASVPAPAAADCTDAGPAMAPEAMTIVQVRLEGPPELTLAAGMPAFDLADGLFLPLGELARHVEFAIEVEPSAGRAQGWFLEQARRFELDLADCRALVDGAGERLDGKRVTAHEGDLYVRLDALERWFPWRLAFDRSRLILAVDSTEPLPIERELARERRWRRLDGRRDENETGDYPTAEVPYRWWDWPFLDLTVEGRTRRDHATGEHDAAARYKLVAAGDLLGHNAEIAVAGDDRRSVSDTFVALGRTDPGGGLLGPLGARRYRLGDLGIPRDPLVGENTLGEGVTVSSFPLDRPQEYDNIDFRGELPIGWDAELYHNGRLVAFQSGSNDSRYDFTGVPLQFGRNRFRIVLYGPQGQVRERTVQRIVGPGMVRPGHQHYRVTALAEDDAPVLPDGERMTRFKGAYELGVTDFLSLGAGLERLTLADGVHEYARLGVRTAGPGFFATLEGARERDAVDATDGRAVYGLLSTAIGPVNLSLETARFADFESERTLDPGLGLLQRRSRLRVDARGRPAGAWSLYLGGELGRARWSRGDTADGSLRLSASGVGWSLSDVVEGRRQQLDGGEPQWTAFNSLLVSARAGRVSLRGRIRHELRPMERLRDAGVNSTWHLGRRVTGRLGVDHRFMDDVTSVRSGLTWEFPWVAVGASLDVADDGDVTALLSLSTGLMRDPNERDWLASARPRTDTGAVAVEVFRDDNANGQREPGEPPLEGVEVGVQRTGVTGVTDAAGGTLLAGLPVHRELALYLGNEGLEDPFLMTRHGGRRVTLRPGRTARIALPVAPAAGFQGRVHELRPGGRTRPAPGVPVRLMDLDGGIVARTETGYDGYYYFDELPPGYYRLRTEHPEAAGDSAGDVILPFRDGAAFMSSIDLYVGNAGGGEARDRGPSAGGADAGGFRTGAWLLEQDPSAYTIQVMAASSENTVQGYIRRRGIRARGAYYRTRWQGQPWYAVVLGVHDDRAAAEAALRRLPAALRTAGPWVRRIGPIQDEIRREQH